MLNKSSLRFLFARNKQSNKKYSSVKSFSSLLMTNNEINDLTYPSTSGGSTSLPTSPYKKVLMRKFHESNFQVSVLF